VEIAAGFFASVAWVTDTTRPGRSAKERLLADIPNLGQGSRGKGSGSR
jgi:hypothetical protein